MFVSAGSESTASPGGQFSPTDADIHLRGHQEWAEAQRRIEELSDENKHLRWRIDYLVRKLYGKSSEKTDPGQLPLELPPGGTPEVEAAPTDAGAAAAGPGDPSNRPKTPHGRGRIPDTLPRVEVIHELAAERTCCSTCQREMTAFTEEVTERLDYEPARIIVRREIRKVYACQDCHDTVVTAPAPAAPIEKGLAAPGLLAQVAISKFCDHTPLYRMERILARSGVHIDRNTLGDWVAASADLLIPIIDEMERRLLENTLLQSDDTPVTVLDGKKPSWTGRLWVYGPPEGDVVFRFTEDRSGDGPLQFLKRFTGVLQADAYSGYDVVFRSLKVTEAGCWAHARRKVFEAQKTDPARAGPLLKAIGDLFEVDRTCEGNSPAARHQARQDKSRPIVDAIDTLARLFETELLPKSPMYAAVGYIRNQWNALVRFLDDGRIPLSNNAAERALRGVAVGRKNWMFLGSRQGGRRAALLFSLVESCKRLCIDPFFYLRDVLGRIPTHPASKIGDLTPKGWKAAFPALAAQATIPGCL